MPSGCRVSHCNRLTLRCGVGVEESNINCLCALNEELASPYWLFFTSDGIMTF
jgi:hypothetical protein